MGNASGSGAGSSHDGIKGDSGQYNFLRDIKTAYTKADSLIVKGVLNPQKTIGENLSFWDRTMSRIQSEWFRGKVTTANEKMFKEKNKAYSFLLQSLTKNERIAWTENALNKKF